MCQLMIQCKMAIKPCLVTVCFTVVTAEHNFAVDIYKIFERCLLSDCSSPRMCFGFILGIVFVDFILGMSFLISVNAYMPLFHLAEASSCTCSENSNKVRNLGSICAGLSGRQPEVERAGDMLALHKRFAAQHKNGKDEGICSCLLSKGTPVESLYVMCFCESDHVMGQEKDKEHSCVSLNNLPLC